VIDILIKLKVKEQSFNVGRKKVRGYGGGEEAVVMGNSKITWVLLWELGEPKGIVLEERGTNHR